MALRVAANCSILFTELHPDDRPAAARAAGFDGVEFWWPFDRSVPSDAEVDRFVRSIEDAGVALVALNLAGGDLAAGERGLLSWPGRETEFRDSVDVAAGVAARCHVEVCNGLYGNRLPGVSPAVQDELARENYAYAAAALAPAGTTVVVEPLSGIPGHPIRRAADAIAVLDAVPGAGLTMLADLYHLAVNGDNLRDVIAAHAPRIGHVQLADAPGRHEPGSGSLPLVALAAGLEAHGYRGWLAAEYQPAGTTTAGLAWLAIFRSGEDGP